MVARWQIRMTLQPDRQGTRGDGHVSSLVNVAYCAEAEHFPIEASRAPDVVHEQLNAYAEDAHAILRPAFMVVPWCSAVAGRSRCA
jgi:hypothetical protein